MLSVPTLWTVFVINFLALGLIWAYVVSSYPAFAPARFWTGSSFVAAAGAAVAMVRVFMTDLTLPLIVAGTALVLAICLAAMGIRTFFDRPASWRGTLLITGLACAGMCFFTYGYEFRPARLAVFTIAETLPLALSLKLLLAPHDGRINPGARLAGMVAALIIGVFGFRLVFGLSGIGGGFSYMNFTPLQSVFILVLVFLSMALNFGFLLMAMDHLRSEVADLALLDDLTGVGNRRHLVQRLTEECARSERSNQPFSHRMRSHRVGQFRDQLRTVAEARPRAARRMTIGSGGQPQRGDGGGRIIAVGTPEQIAANKASYTGRYLRSTLALPAVRKRA